MGNTRFLEDFLYDEMTKISETNVDEEKNREWRKF